ncbi:MAG: exodeoxyribonuclease III, partial [Candidatus Omnitrophica bacterium]|nr:exodeoxyribonuclease III [Candidatus Omnitrophota bacterium]
MKILSWNVNGIRAVEKKGFLDWFQKESPDILCVQETKCHPDQLEDDLLKPKGYKTFWSSAEKKGYSGVAIFTKKEPKSFSQVLGKKEFDCEGRQLILDFGNFVLLNIYFPNGGAGNKRVPYKMKYYDKFLQTVDALKRKGKDVIVCGDVNTAHAEIDLARPRENEENTGFLPEERAWVSKFISHGYVDTFRHLHPQEPNHYTYWDYKTGARARNVGWRIDYFFVNGGFLPRVKSSFILKDVLGSDHCPIG